MIKVNTDIHIHTNKSDHAHSTITECANYAQSIGFEVIAVTEHGPALGDAPHPSYFGGIDTLPSKIGNVRILKGVEANIIDFDGNIDMKERHLKLLDWVVAGFHYHALKPGSFEEHTNAYMKLADNPYIDMISHCGSDNYKFDYEPVIKKFAEKNIVVEINNHSFEVRKGSDINCREIALLCMKYRCPIAVTSDAHFHEGIGSFENSLRLLNDINFPEELIINTTKEKLFDFIFKKKGIRFE